jgi:thiol:disulfide interchange protein DsbD
MGLRSLFWLICMVAWVLPAARAAEPARPSHVETRLIAESQAVTPGTVLTVGLRQIIEPGWHTYWLNPGDGGEPLHVTWHLPPGFTAGPLVWPAPERIVTGPLVNYGYSKRTLLLTTVTVPKDAVPGRSVTLNADVSWLVCADICVPEEATLSLTLPVIAGAVAPDPLWAADFMAAREARPQVFSGTATASVEKGVLHLAAVGGGLPAQVSEAAFFPYTSGLIRNAAPQVLESEPGAIGLDIPAGPKAVADAPVSGVLTVSDGTIRRVFALAAAPVTAADDDALSLPMILLFALLGGLILNLMPCVFPVLSMKALMIAQHAKAGRGQALRQGLAYGLGVVLSFVLIGVLLLALRGAGAQIGWGFQFQSPALVALMALLFFAIALNLLGLFDVALLQSVGANTRREGLAGAFLTGALAALVASPCTAPFMAAALGAGLTTPPPVTLAIFAGLGLGMAAPFTLLSASPSLFGLLPKPGPWMVRLKQWLALPMMLACLWLVWVLGQQIGWAGLGLLGLGAAGLGFALRAIGRHQRGGPRRLVVLGGGIIALIAAITLIAVTPLSLRSARDVSAVPSESYAPNRLAALRAEGRPVFVNLTAAWCITCRYNELSALSSETVAAAFRAHDVAYLKGDWTLRDPEITRLLAAYGRNGVPLYLIFPPHAARGVMLPQLLSEDMVIRALSAAALPAR